MRGPIERDPITLKSIGLAEAISSTANRHLSNKATKFSDFVIRSGRICMQFESGHSLTLGRRRAP